MATIGRTAQGTLSDSGFQGYKAGSPAQLVEPGTFTSLSVWVDVLTAAVTARAMIYADNGAGSPGALKGTSADHVISVGSSQFVTFTFTGQPQLPIGTYWLVVGFDSAGGGAVNASCVSVGTGIHKFVFGSTATDPFGAASTSVSAGDMAVSAVYTPAPTNFQPAVLGGSF